MAKKIGERRDHRYHATCPRARRNAVHPPERGASKDRLRRIADQVATTEAYDAVKVVGQH